MKTLFARCATLILSLLATACWDPPPPEPTPTEKIYPRLVVETDGAGLSRIDLALVDHRGEAVTLSPHDRIHAWFGYFGHDEFAGPETTFHAEHQTGSEAGQSFEFDLTGPGRTFALGSRGSLPAPMDLLSPQPMDAYAYRDDLLVAWAPAGYLDTMSVRVEADCVSPDGPDDGGLDEAFTLDITGDPGAFSFVPADHLAYEADCNRYAALVTLVRSRPGTIDGSFAPEEEQCGEACVHRELFVVSQVRAVAIVLTP